MFVFFSFHFNQGGFFCWLQPRHLLTMMYIDGGSYVLHTHRPRPSLISISRDWFIMHPWMSSLSSVPTSGRNTGLYSHINHCPACPAVEWSHRSAAIGCFDENDSPSLVPASVWRQRCVKRWHWTKSRLFKKNSLGFQRGVLDQRMMSQVLQAGMGRKLTQQSALICLIIDCNQWGGGLKASSSGYNEWINGRV